MRRGQQCRGGVDLLQSLIAGQRCRFHRCIQPGSQFAPCLFRGGQFLGLCSLDRFGRGMFLRQRAKPGLRLLPIRRQLGQTALDGVPGHRTGLSSVEIGQLPGCLLRIPVGGGNLLLDRAQRIRSVPGCRCQRGMFRLQRGDDPLIALRLRGEFLLLAPERHLPFTKRRLRRQQRLLRISRRPGLWNIHGNRQFLGDPTGLAQHGVKLLTRCRHLLSQRPALPHGLNEDNGGTIVGEQPCQESGRGRL